MNCPRCQSRNRRGAMFCSVCGSTLRLACGACRTAVPLGSRFCDHCGSAMPPAGLVSATPRRFRTPRDYTPAHLAERVWSTRSAIEGERKQVTVLFADIKSSLEMLAERDPEEARALLDPVLEQMIEAVHAFDGIVNQVMGDGIMALFGAPIALEDHAARAGFAALRMLQRAGGAGHVRQPPVPVLLRIGINSGEVLVRAIGSDLGMDYSAVGRTTHVAARLEQMAQPGTALCAALTLQLAQGSLRARALGAVPVRGLAEPLDVAELLGAERTVQRFQAAAARGLAPLVGRQAEQAAIAQALERAAAGQGQVVVLVGEPGVGKSRLVWETTQSAALRDWLVLQGGAASYGVGMPYLPVRNLLQAYCAISHQDPPATARARVLERLTALGATVDEVVVPLLALLELPLDDARWAALDPAQRRLDTNEAVRWLLWREAQSRPVLVVVEDLHWSDRETEALLDALVERLAPQRIVLMVNARPEYQHAWSSKASVSQVRVPALGEPEARALLAALLGRDAALAPLAATIGARTGGNPFFIEECVRSLAEAGVLTGAPGDYALAPSAAAPAAPLPPTVQAVVAARIDRLAPDDKRLLQAAATLGAVVPVAVLDAMPSLGGIGRAAALARLHEAEFLHELRRYPQAEYGFVHALTAEVAYAGMVHEQRRAVHAEIAAAIATTYADRLQEHVERLADHALRGESWPDAVRWGRLAAQKASARSAYREALAFLEQALQAAARLPDERDTLALRIDLRIEMRSVLFPLREITRDLQNLEAAEPLAERLADPRRTAQLLTLKTRDLSILGHARRALECGRRAVAAAEAVGELELEVLANAYLGSVCVARGAYREAIDTLNRGIAALHGASALARFGLPGPAAVIFRVWLVTALTRLGEFEAAAREVAESVAVAERADQPLARLVARYTAGFLLAHRGRYTEAIAELEASLELCRRWRLPAWFSNIASVLGWACALSGRGDEGIALMRQAIEASVQGGGMVNHSSEVARLAEGLLHGGDPAQARALAEQALALARQYEERGNEAIALHLLAVVAQRIDPDDPGAADYQRQAAAIAHELGMRTFTTATTAA